MDREILRQELDIMGAHAREASRALALMDSEAKGLIIAAMAGSLRKHASEILAANQRDITAFQEKGGDSVMVDRLKLTPDRIEAMAAGLSQIAEQPDPVGEKLGTWVRPNGMTIEQVKVPIGVIAMIYESRPNVTADAAGLCIKAGNAVILRGGSDAIHSNLAIWNALNAGGLKAGLPPGAIQMIPGTRRESVIALAQLDRWVDLLIPRGGRSLIQTIVQHARVPVIKHYDGVCHVFADAEANPDMAASIIVNAKVSRPSACNAAETLLVDSRIATTFLPLVIPQLKAHGVELRACARTMALAGNCAADLIPAAPEDFGKEFLALVLSIRTVDGVREAIHHINHHGSGHSDAIVTENTATANLFLQGVDSACVYHNVSTRFSDGFEFGFGAEIGISTDKLHARGPMGARDLTSYQYRIVGTGQIRE